MKKESRFSYHFPLIFLLISFILLPSLFAVPKTTGLSGKIDRKKLDNSLPLYIKKEPNKRLITLYFTIKDNISRHPPTLSGLDNATLSLLLRGSKEFNYSAISAFSYNTHTEFNTYSIADGSVIGFTCLDKYFTDALNIFSSCLLTPTFPDKEYKTLMNDYEQDVKALLNSPEQALFYNAEEVVYKGSVYETTPYITPKSLPNITLDAIKDNYHSLLDLKRLSIIVVGNVEDNLTSSLNTLFSKIEETTPPLAPLAECKLNLQNKTYIYTNEEASDAGYFLRLFPSAPVDSADYIPCRIASLIYSDLLFNLVREHYGACYSPSSSVKSSKSPYGYEYLYRVTALKECKTYLNEARNYMKNGLVFSSKDKDGAVKKEKLATRLPGYINSYINQKYAIYSTTGGKASQMAACVLQFSDIEHGTKMLEEAKKVKVKDILKVFNKYWTSKEEANFYMTCEERKKEIPITN